MNQELNQIKQIQQALTASINELDGTTMSFAAQKKWAVAKQIISASEYVVELMLYLKKKPRILRRKPYSRKEAGLRTALFAMRMEMMRTNLLMLQQQPVPKYPPGGISTEFFNYYNAEGAICRPLGRKSHS